MKSLLWVILCLFLFSSTSQAGVILKTNGKKVFLKFSQDDNFTEGDIFYIKAPNGKKIGLVKIMKVRGFKAIGMLQKGKAVQGGSTEFKGIAKSAKKKVSEDTVADEDGSSSSDEDSEENEKPLRPPRSGLLLGYGMATQDVTDPSPGGGGQTYSLKGSSIAIKGLYDYPYMDTLTFRGLLGLEIFSVSGDGPAGSKIGTDIKYLVGDAIIKWDFYENKDYIGYFTAGTGLYFPAVKSSTALAAGSYTTFLIGQIGGGIEMKFVGYSVPLEVSYYYFPAGPTVKSNVISIKTGFVF